MCRRTPLKGRSAFTLLEVIIATMIIGLLTVTLFHFVSTNLRAIRFSTDLSAEREALQAVVRLLEQQLRDLPPQSVEALSGRPLKFRGLSNDEITWRSTAGSGLLTTAARGEYRVTLTVQPVSGKARETELGLRRQRIDPTKAIDVSAKGGGDSYNWVPLIRPMAALEIRYYNSQLSDWQDTWSDPNQRPALVRVRLWKQADAAPLEALLAVPAAHLRP